MVPSQDSNPQPVNRKSVALQIVQPRHLIWKLLLRLRCCIISPMKLANMTFELWPWWLVYIGLWNCWQHAMSDIEFNPLSWMWCVRVCVCVHWEGFVMLLSCLCLGDFVTLSLQFPLNRTLRRRQSSHTRTAWSGQLLIVWCRCRVEKLWRGWECHKWMSWFLYLWTVCWCLENHLRHSFRVGKIRIYKKINKLDFRFKSDIFDLNWIFYIFCASK